MDFEPTSWLDRLLGLDVVSLFGPRTSIEFSHALPAWAWVMIVLASLGFAAWSYHRLIGRRPVRVLLTGVRGLLVLLIVALLCGPGLVRTDETVDPDQVLMLVDRSASLQIQDTPAKQETSAQGDAPDGPRPPADSTGVISRDQALRRALQRQAATFDQAARREDRRVRWLGFGGQAFVLNPASLFDSSQDNAQAGAQADQPATAIDTALDQALRRLAGQPVAGIVLLSDGRSPQRTDGQLIRRLDREAASVYAVPLGAEDLPLDLAVAEVQAPRRAFTGDIAPVSVTVRQLGNTDEPVDPANVTVRLADTNSDRVFDQTTLAQTGAGLGQPVRLEARSEQIGTQRWRVEVEYDPPDMPSDDHASTTDHSSADRTERIQTNNREQFEIELIDRPIRVLYIEGYPRWEYRYLKNLLLREESIDSSILLLSADRGFAQEGNTPISRMPATVEEMTEGSGYDVVIIGDVPPSYFSTRQFMLIRDQVARRGAGLIWIGGPRHTASGYGSTPLGNLLPMANPSQVTRLDPGRGPIHLDPTALANQLRVLQLRGPDEAIPGDQPSGRASSTPTQPGAAETWPDALPPLRWVQNLGRLKPAAEVLAIGRAGPGSSQTADGGKGLAVVVRMRYGSGQSIYLGTDETWRWRYGRGELYFEQFWVQIVRMLGRQRVQQFGQRARLAVSPEQPTTDQAAVIELTVDDPALLQRDLDQVRVQVRRAGDSQTTTLRELTLRRTRQGSEARQRQPPSARQTFQATWRPRTPGRLELRVVESALAGLDLRRPVTVRSPDSELANPQTDHARLAYLAEQTGGAVVPLDQLDRLMDVIPNRARHSPNDIREPIWNSPAAFIVVLILLTTEWIVRKAIRLI